MIKTKLIAILLSGCLATSAGAVSLFANANGIKVNDIKKVVETKLNESFCNSQGNNSNSNENAENNESNNNYQNNGTSNNTPEQNENTNQNTQPSEDINKPENNTKPEDTIKPEDTSKPEDTTKPGDTNIPENNTKPEENNSDNTGNTENNNGETQNEASDSYIAEIEQAVFQRVNLERTAAGLPALSYNNTMEHYARLKSKDMGDRSYFDHANPEGKLITEQMKADGVTYRAWGENIAYISGMSGNSELATKFMNNWMNSPGHRANILSSNFSSIGVGVYKIGNTYYATQEFYK